MRKTLIFLTLFLFAATPVVARAATPLVDVDWLKENAQRPEVVILDVRNKLGGGSKDAYLAGHIPGAVYSDYLRDGWRTKVNGVIGQLPPLEHLERLIGGLGIDNDSHVVIVAGGTSALDMGSATRVYWTLKVVGHDKVSILDGGHRAYAADPANSLESGWNEPEARAFNAAFRPEMIADRGAVEAFLRGDRVIVDYRPVKQYRGLAKHPAAKRKGTIPGAVNVPESRLTSADGTFVAGGEVDSLLAELGVDAGDPQVAFCNTGHWASLGWFASSELAGNKDVKLYDGSMVDWSAHDALPIEVKAGE
ncbi:MAG: sulfurtransferase [Pseudomonadota bacterium]